MTLIRSGIRRRPEPVLGQLIPIKSKVCKTCRMKFIPDLPGALVCSELCAMAFAVSVNGREKKVQAVKDRKETRAKLDQLKSRSQWAKEAQAAFNAWVRLRDADLPCISCGRYHGGQYHAGHYLSVGARPELRFIEINVHKQCAPCNTHLSGNAVPYRKALMERIGLAAVEWLEGPHALPHHSISELRAIRADYAARARAFMKARA